MKAALLYQSVTQTIIEELKAGVCPWTQPWKSATSGPIMPHNAVTKRCYSGINVPILWHAQHQQAYPSASWLTYNQAQEAGGQVRAGEKSTPVIFYRQLTVEEDNEEREISLARVFRVFNIAQIDGLQKEEPTPLLSQEQRDSAALRFIEATGATINHGGGRACYIPSRDVIEMPSPLDFDSYEHYLATALHELCHWSGHKSRLNRDLKTRFDVKAYAAEELIAELGAAFLCAHLGIQGQLRHADYIANWLQLLENDDRAIFTASSKASQAADYLRSFSERLEEAA